MDIFNYHPTTKEYLSTEIADLDPIDQLPLIPGYATDIPVITVSNGSVAVFDGTIWTEIEDNRGYVYDVNTKIKEIYNELGELPNTLTTLVPNSEDSWSGSKWNLDIELIKINKKQEISASFESNIKSGYITNSINMDADINDILKLNAAIKLAERLVENNISIRDYNNNTNNVSIVIANNIIEELGINYKTLLNKKWTLIDNIELETNITNLNLIVW